MNQPKILTLGKYMEDDFIVSTSKSNRKIDPIIEGKIDKIWGDKKRKADENGQICYNGMSYRLNSLKEENNKIYLDFGIIEYKVRDGLIEIPEYFDLPEEFYRKGCYTMATVKTNDNYYLMVELSGKSMNLNKTDLLGGIMETDIEMSTGSDIFKSLFKELEEEACIDKLDINELYIRSIFLGINTNVGLYFEINLNKSLSSILTKFKQENKDQDIKSLQAFPRNEYIEILRNHKSSNKKIIPELLNI